MKINLFSKLSLKQRQANTIAMVIFWSQFAVYTFNTVLILYLTRPIWKYGIGYSEIDAYTFMGVAYSVGYLMPMIGGYMADKVVGLRRSIFVGCVLVACAYLLVMLSGFTVKVYADKLFLAAYALIPVTGSLLVGTSSALVSRVYREDEVGAKIGMTIYYMSINVGALLATIISPQLMQAHYGPLTIFAIVFVGKSIAALNFAWRYKLYDNVIDVIDEHKMTGLQVVKLIIYILAVYALTLVVFFYPYLASYFLGALCTLGVLWFMVATLKLHGEVRVKQLVAVLLIVEAVVFFVIYNQMNTTLILFAKNNSDLLLFGIKVAPANFQMVNPIAIIMLSLLLPKFYRAFHKFSIPYQFAAGTALSGVSLLVMWFACLQANAGLISGNYLVLTYFLMTIAELWVSAVGLSMIGLYCDPKSLGFAMGAWYLSVSLSNVVSGRIAGLVAIPKEKLFPMLSLPIYERYYFYMGAIALIFGVVMFVIAVLVIRLMHARKLKIA